MGTLWTDRDGEAERGPGVGQFGFLYTLPLDAQSVLRSRYVRLDTAVVSDSLFHLFIFLVPTPWDEAPSHGAVVAVAGNAAPPKSELSTASLGESA